MTNWTDQIGAVVDLSHAFGPTTPLYEGFPGTRMDPVKDLLPLGVQSHYYGFAGQCGTHFDPPGHLVEGMKRIDAICADDLVLPLAVIDVVDKVNRDSDYLLSIGDLLSWEQKHGRFPRRCFVAMRTDWSQRWPDDEALQNRDDAGVTHWPGWTREAVDFLAHERDVVAIGHETIGTDGGVKTARGDFSVQRAWHTDGRYQIELMCGLDRVPPTDALIVCGVPKPIGGSGFPVRMLALVPQ